MADASGIPPEAAATATAGAAEPDPPNPARHRTIGEHGIIGDLSTAALVARDGTIDYLCWPRLDSPTLFAALLDPARGGEFALAPTLDNARLAQIYVPDTNVLITAWLARDGTAELTDLMPHPDADGPLRGALVRHIRAVRGDVGIRMRCRPRPDYARAIPVAAARDGAVAFTVDGRTIATLWASIPLAAGDAEATAAATLAHGEEAFFVLLPEGADLPDADAARDAIAATIALWRRWSRVSGYRGRWREQVARSALALKLLTSRRHGSIAAAATFGLPEAMGGPRNWDYRATWIRDASFTIYAFLRLGYLAEAEAFRLWIAERARHCGECGTMQVMYALDGSAMTAETALDHLAGYGGSRPVRIGNDARDQHQLDIYGELLDTIYLGNKYASAISRDGWGYVRAVIEQVRARWRHADAGIWELRDGEAELLHSRLMCWVALDRGIRLAHKRSLAAPVVDWMQDRDRIADDIWTRFRHPEHGHFVQRAGGRDVDAALLMMPLVRFVSATDPVWLATLDAIRDQLADDGLLLRRYRVADGLEGQEGAFTTCTFWYVECLARAGRLADAHLAMEKGLGLANHLGLFAEEADAEGLPLGNFPQALTHLAFISAAHFLDRRLDDPTGGEWQP